ncbi:CocE/NonD family hydrolase [Devosia sp.]|jgi:putative CocE/NonD family hydrolase|uniref:CocE/NonD family hydrolase n=1 Tax=Devosia sp. TaxID=1871048 RepID=UPI0037C114C7
MPKSYLTPTSLFFAATMAVLTTPSSAQGLATLVPMRDGVKLETYIYLPEGAGPFPTLIARTMYGPPLSPIGGELMDSSMTIEDFEANGDEDENDEPGENAGMSQGWPLLTQNGYALVVQTTRGRYGSEGIDRTWRDDGPDGYDLVEWVAKQPWSNGRIGMFGDSAVGMSAALAAGAQPPALDAIFLQATSADPFGTDMAPRDGALRTESLLLQGGSLAPEVSSFHLDGRGITVQESSELIGKASRYVAELLNGLEQPLASAAWVARPLGDVPELTRLMPFWSMLSDSDFLEQYRADTNVLGKITVPTSIVTLWQDTFVESSMALFADLESRGVASELLVVNGTHYEIDDPRIFPQPRLLSWFDHWLKDAPAPSRLKVEMAVQSDDVFVETSTLSDAFAAKTRLYFGNGELGSDIGAPGEVAFLSDPGNPVPTLGGRNLLAASGATDQSALIGRSDTALFMGMAAEGGKLLAGHVTGALTIESDVPSFDASIRLLDIAPDGSAILVVSDHVRVSSIRDDIARVNFDMGEILHRLKAGHRFAVMIAGSDFPAWDRNPQTGASIFTTSEVAVGRLSIQTGPEAGSYIDLPLAASQE